MSHDGVADARANRATFSTLTVPAVDSPWESPYRLLAGAAYSLTCAGTFGESRTLTFEWPEIDAAIVAGNQWTINASWGQTWLASYFITNGIFRIAAATEKLCDLRVESSDRVVPGKNYVTTRDVIREACKNALHPLNNRIGSLRTFLEPWGGHRYNQTKQFLQDQADIVNGNGVTAYPLLCCIYQTDKDKHVPYPPTKKPFYWEIAYRGFEQACTLYKEAAPQ